MKKLDPNKLYVSFFPGTSTTYPIIPRYYTLTHSDETGDLFLSIGSTYIYDQISKNRDEVLGKWKNNKEQITFSVNIHVDSEPVKSFADSSLRYSIFKRELPLALEAIRFGDQALFILNPYLDRANIVIHFSSSYPKLCKTESWGTFADYR
ncbi:MAG: hypothetical protein H6Q72_1446 [Firmicutes bacterium]|nr:hypothetical protein [Bacillota bacterium]